MYNTTLHVSTCMVQYTVKYMYMYSTNYIQYKYSTCMVQYTVRYMYMYSTNYIQYKYMYGTVYC